MKRPWTPGEDAELRCLYRQGVKLATIGKRLGRPRHGVAWRCRHIGLSRTPPCHKAAVRALHADGLNDAEIARRLKIHATTAWRVRRRLGLPAVGRSWGTLPKPQRRRIYLRNMQRSGCRNFAQFRYDRESVRCLLDGWPPRCSARTARSLAAVHRLGPVTRPDLASHLGMKPHSVSRLFMRLLARGWVTHVGRSGRWLLYDLTPAVRRNRDLALARREAS